MAIKLYQGSLGIAHPGINQPLPKLQVLDFTDHNQQHTLLACENKVTLITIWASWCYSCVWEHEFLMKISKQKNIHLIGINYKDQRSSAKRIFEKYGNPYALNLTDPTGQTAIKLGVYGTPETLVVDEQGILRARISGPLDEERWQGVIDPVVQKIVPRAKKFK